MRIIVRLFSIFCFLLLTKQSFATDYYVSPDGNNSNPGTSSQPWKTIQYGIDQLTAGDQLVAMSGVYNEKIVFNVSGSSDEPIRLISAGGAILDGTGLTGATAMIEITDQSYVIVQNMEIRNNVMYDAQGIVVQGNCQGIALLDNVIHDIHFSSNPSEVADATKNAQGIIVWGTDATHAISNLAIMRNELFDCRLGYSEGIAINGNVDGFALTKNKVHDLTNIGIVAIGHEQTCSDPALDQARNGLISENEVYACHSPYAACGGIYVDGAKNIAILSNSVRSNDYGIEVGCEHPGKTASEITVRNNIIRLNTVAGMALGGYDYPSESGSVVNCSVYNNDFWSNDGLNDGNGEIVISYIENCLIENNMFVPNSQGRAITFADPSASGVALNYNLYFMENGDQSNLFATTSTEMTLANFQLTGQETNGIYADPLLDFYDDDMSFSLFNNTTSPLIDAGNPAYAVSPDELDFFGQPRVGSFSSSAVIEIGASELVIEGLEGFSQVNPVIFPNPATNEISLQSDQTWIRYEVLDLAGSVRLSGLFKVGALSVSGLDAGAYIIRVYNNERSGSTRFIKL